MDHYELLAFVLGNLGSWLIYTGLVWGMIKVQRLNYNVLGLFASTGLAVLVSWIPWVGWKLSYPVLLFCLWKCTGEDIVPDILFTVGVAGALMFAVNLFVIGALMGDIRPSAAFARDMDESALVEVQEEPEQAPTNAPAKPRPAQTPAGLNLKGVSVNAGNSLAMIGSGNQLFTIGIGEGFTMRSPQGPLKVRCEEIHRDHVLLSLNDADKVKLHLK
jgi:hypothetical protein